METNSEVHENVEMSFTYEGEDLIWNGDIEVTEEIYRGDYDTPDYSEVTYNVIRTNSLQRYNEDTGDWGDVEVTPSIIWEIELNLDKNF